MLDGEGLLAAKKRIFLAKTVAVHLIKQREPLIKSHLYELISLTKLLGNNSIIALQSINPVSNRDPTPKPKKCQIPLQILVVVAKKASKEMAGK